MANALYCQDNSSETINFSGQTIPIGSYITATDSPPANDIINYCFEITDVSASGTYTATTNTFSSCYDCLANNYAVVILSPCDSNYPYDRPVFDITDFGYIVQEGIFNLEFTIEGGSGTETYSGCFEFEGLEQLSEDDYNGLPTNQQATLVQIFFSNYTTCDECLYGFSAGTESTICVVCCPCTTGETISSVSAPHPTWTNGQGQAVIQLNAITLGGPNGLNN
jgi:hypothetical protein